MHDYLLLQYSKFKLFSIGVKPQHTLTEWWFSGMFKFKSQLKYSEGNEYKIKLYCFRLPVFLSNCSPKDMTGIADAKNIYVVGAKILKNRSKLTNQKPKKVCYFTIVDNQ